jgi:hypothetical protein
MKKYYYGPSNIFKTGDPEKGRSNEFLVLEHGQVALHWAKLKIYRAGEREGGRGGGGGLKRFATTEVNFKVKFCKI